MPMTDPCSISLQESFAERQPGVKASFGGASRLFDRWWHDMEMFEPLDDEFVENYSTNDRFLCNRLILPEEIPLLVLPLLRHVIVRSYRQIVFCERSAQPWLWAANEILTLADRSGIRLRSFRVKALARESLSANILTVLSDTPSDLAWLNDGLNRNEREAWAMHMPESFLHGFVGTHADLIALVADLGIDSRVNIPMALKAAVFHAGNLAADGPVCAERLRRHCRDRYGKSDPFSLAAVEQMIAKAENRQGQIQLTVIVDAMNDAISHLRGTLQHGARPLLHALLSGTETARSSFAEPRTLFVDELSVSGGSCFAMELIAGAFRPGFDVHFASVIGMRGERSFLDADAGSFFDLKPMEDVPWISPHWFVPVYTRRIQQTTPIHRFPSCCAQSLVPAWWRRESWVTPATPSPAESEAAWRDWERVIANCVFSEIPDADSSVIRRRATSDPDLLPTLLAYYLGCFDLRDDVLHFQYDPHLEARLENVLGFCGRLQKPFFHEMDQLFRCLVDRERSQRWPLGRWREDFHQHRPTMNAIIVSDVLRDRLRFESRMRRGLEAVRSLWSDVRTYLYMPDGTDEVEFCALKERLQRAIL